MNTPALNIFAFISILGAVQGLLIALALVNLKRGNANANRFLSLFLIALSLTILDLVFIETYYYLHFPYFLGLPDPFIFVLGPLFLFYIRTLFNENFYFSGRSWLHFIPFAFFFITSLPLYFINGQQKSQWFQESMVTHGTDFVDYLFWAMENGHILIYTIIAFYIVLKNHRHATNIAQSSNNPNNKLIFYLSAALFAIAILTTILDFVNLNELNIRITPFLLTLIIYAMGYLGIRQADIFSVVSKGEEKKYQKSMLSAEQSKTIGEKLTSLMVQEQVFKDSNISLPKLAKRLNVSPHYLSQTINEQFSQNFFNYINDFRIAAAKETLTDVAQSHQTIAEIAYETGFNSLSAFNRAFKKHTGLTPSQFRTQNQP